MTATELIAELRKQPKDAEVFFDMGPDEDGEDSVCPVDFVEQDTDDEGNVIVCLGEGDEEGDDDGEEAGGEVIDVDFQRVAS